MTGPARKLRLSFQIKVLLPALAALVIVPALTLWIVDRHISQQVQDESRRSLAAAETVFRQSLDIKSRDLLTRFRGAVNESSYLSIAQLLGSKDPHAAETIRQFLNERLEAYGDDYDALVLTADGGAAPVGVRHGATFDLDEWIRTTQPLARLALQGEATHAPVEFRGRGYLVVVVPVSSVGGGAPIGALTVASRITEPTLQELRSLAGAEILLVSGGAITVSTLHLPEPPSVLSTLGATEKDAGTLIRPVEVGREHFLARTGRCETAAGVSSLQYVLLSSYEKRLSELSDTRLMLLAVSVLGILLSSLVVWLLIRRAVHPLVELRENAEAVGHGDFTRRIAHFSNDECGEVAVAFNGMTENLQASRAELEQAIATVRTTQAQLIQSEKLSAVGQFVAGIAHELNNPLTTVIGFSELLQHTELDEKYKGQVERISQAATRCHKIVHSLLGFARQHGPERKLSSLHDIVDAVLEFLSYDLRTNNIAVVREYAVLLPPIMADAHQLQQVILNIISNARQAIEAYRRDGRLILRTETDGTLVRLRIIDNGPGMSRETLSRIFDPFFTTKPQGKGTGLGLSLSYGIIQEHQGSIRAESEPGSGATFIIELPAVTDTTGLGPGKAASAVPFRRQGPALRILVVDDEDAILHLVQEVLRADGHSVDAADSGLAALKLVAQNPYDVIVSDWKMPGLSGLQVHEELLAKNPAQARRMLFMTGDVVGENFQDYLRKHSLSCLPKPFALREFQAAIDRLERAK